MSISVLGCECDQVCLDVCVCVCVNTSISIKAQVCVSVSEYVLCVSKCVCVCAEWADVAKPVQPSGGVRPAHSQLLLEQDGAEWAGHQLSGWEACSVAPQKPV